MVLGAYVSGFKWSELYVNKHSPKYSILKGLKSEINSYVECVFQQAFVCCLFSQCCCQLL